MGDSGVVSSDEKNVQSRDIVVTAQDWNGENDPENPRNYSVPRKTFATFAYTGLAFVSTLAASIYSPGSQEVANQFHVAEEIGILPITLYNLGLAFGPIVGSPLSETAGRKAVVLVTTPLFALFVIGTGFSQTVAGILVCRFFAGVFAAPAIGNASATITDYMGGQYRAVAMSIYYAMPTFGSVLGPLLGGFVVETKGWRWTQWTTCFFIAAFYVPVLFTRETYKKTILQRRAKRLGILGPPSPQRTVMQSIQHFVTVLVQRPVHMMLTEPIVTLVCTYCGFLFGLLYTFVVASPWVFEHYYHFDLSGQSLSFLGLMVGTLSSTIPLLFLDRLVYQPRLARFRKTHSSSDVFPPEHRLYPAMMTAPLMPCFLVVFGWTAQYSVHWICPIIFQGLAMLCSATVYASMNIYMLDAYGPLYGASAAGAGMLSRYTFSAVSPLYSLQLYRALGAGWATTLLALFTLAMAPIPWLFWKYGEQIRRKSKYETST